MKRCKHDWVLLVHGYGQLLHKCVPDAEMHPPCFGEWHPGRRMCWRCEAETDCYADFCKVYGPGRVRPRMDRTCAQEAGEGK